MDSKYALSNQVNSHINQKGDGTIITISSIEQNAIPT
jgi:hypothetical protein